MSDNILKGNFKVKNPIQEEKKTEQSLEKEVKERTLLSLSGSMVYVERKRLDWDGDE